MRKLSPSGFTLIEVLVTIAVFTLAIVTITNMTIQFYRSQTYAIEESTAINEARKGVETMIQDIRKAEPGADGSYLIEKADDNEFIFYSDIDNDGIPERVRYFRGTQTNGSQSKQCVTFSNGSGSCSVNFSNFFSGTLNTAQMTVNVEGDLGNAPAEYADVVTDGAPSGRMCQSACTDCAGAWQGTSVFNVTASATDNVLNMTTNASNQVNNICNWVDPNHSMKAKFDLSWTETATSGDSLFKKGVIRATGTPLQYPTANEIVTTLSEYVRNTTTPIFRYFDQTGTEITTNPARPEQTTLMRVSLIVNVNPSRAPNDYLLESDVQLRNLKTNL